MIHDGDRRVRQRPHRDEDLLGVVAAIRVDRGVRPTGLLRPRRHGVGQGRREQRVVRPLADATLHIAVLVLDDARHQGIGGLEQRLDRLPGIAHECAQQLVFR